MRADNTSLKPDFLCIGPHKTGTTWLYSKLYWHPQIWLPPKKELWVLNLLEEPYLRRLKNLLTKSGQPGEMRKIFEQDCRSLKPREILKLDSYCRLVWWFKYLFFPYSLSTYPHLFPKDPRLVTGDITPNYYFLKENIIRQLHHFNPNLKIIIILRNPVERVWSYVKMNFRDSYHQPIEAVSETELIQYLNQIHSWWKPYSSTIDLWQSYFQEIFVTYFDHLEENSVNFHNQICHFLGITTSTYAQNFTQRINVGTAMELPDTIKQYLNAQYIDEVRELAKCQSHPYVNRWLAEMEKSLLN